MYTLKIDAFTHTGQKKALNEDSFAFHKEQNFCILADGVGGNSGGEIASSLAVDSCYSSLKESEKKFQRSKHIKNIEYLKSAISNASTKIRSHKLMRPQLQKMSTTIVVTKIMKDCFYFAHVGDSQINLVRENCIYTLTKDHLVSNDLKQSRDTKNLIKKNILSRSLGEYTGELIDGSYIEIKAKDCILLSSDGFHNFIEKNTISNMLKKHVSTKDLVMTALNNGSNDNISLITIKVL